MNWETVVGMIWLVIWSVFMLAVYLGKKPENVVSMTMFQILGLLSVSMLAYIIVELLK